MSAAGRAPEAEIRRGHFRPQVGASRRHAERRRAGGGEGTSRGAALASAGSMGGEDNPSRASAATNGWPRGGTGEPVIANDNGAPEW